MLIHEAELDFFVYVMQENGAGEFIVSQNKFSSSRQPFGDGHIVFGNPMNSQIRVSHTTDIKQIEKIWQDAINQAAQSIKEDSSDEDSKQEN